MMRRQAGTHKQPGPARFAGFGIGIISNALRTIYVATGQSVFKSTDGGANWSTSNTGNTVGSTSTFAFVKSRPNTVYLGSLGDGVVKAPMAESVGK
jgi:hypothetical protein